MAIELIRLARMRLMRARPYLGAPLTRMPLIRRDGGIFVGDDKSLPAPLGVDDKWRCYYDLPLIEQMFTRDQLAWVLYHELLHLLLGHPVRNANLEPVKANIAADLVINWQLEEELPSWTPKNCLLPEHFDLPNGKTLGWYYRHLPKDAAKQLGQNSIPEIGVASGACGSCANGSDNSNEDGKAENGDEVSGVGRIENRAMRESVAKEIVKSVGRGTVPAHLKRWAEKLLEPSRVPWQKELRAHVSRLVGKEAGRVDYTYSRLARRSHPDFVFPSMYSPKISAGFVFDTSGSMGPAEIKTALEEVNGVFKKTGLGEARFMAVDAAVHCDEWVRDVTQVKARLSGGGGTDMCLGIDAMLRGRTPSVVVVFTDGETPWPETNKYPFGIIACIVTGRRSSYYSVPDFIRTIEVPKGDLRKDKAK